LLTDAYASMRAVGAVDEADAARLVTLGVDRARVQVTGDTRYVQVLALAQSVARASSLIAPLVSPRPTLVAGSTWPSDEQVLEDAWRHVRATVPAARLIIAPHETTEAHLSAIEAWTARGGLRAARLGAPEAGAADVVVVDRVGVLGDLYALADVAYVGGGFHSAGLHSVIEPAAFGAPVLFGPRCTDSRDAGLLIATRGGRTAANAQELGESLARWMADASARADAGARAREMVQKGTGAAERSYELVQALI
ncbi:MAG: 3-deoxy-D-manno-octulosonic acid transferase, partial [Gemmatimonadaceae bacterium]